MYPLLLEPIYKQKVWGGRRFERLGRRLPGGPDVRWGESWEVADLAATAPSGGGGDAARSVVENGPLAGRTLSDLMAERGGALLGSATPSDEGGFPLLVKYLDAREDLSVQVHPSPAYAARHPEARLKSEAWYVVDAEPGSRIYAGLVAGTTRSDMERAIREGTVPDLLVAVPAIPGEAHYLPSGICHALGAGVLVAEVQTPSDTTFRVYDWGRADREIHVAEALEATTYEAAAPPAAPVHGAVPDDAPSPGPSSSNGGRSTPRPDPVTASRPLARCEHFCIDEWSLGTGERREAVCTGPEVWMVIEGALELEPGSAPFEPVRVPGGRTVLLAASLGSVVARAATPTRLLRVTIP